MRAVIPNLKAIIELAERPNYQMHNAGLRTYRERMVEIATLAGRALTDFELNCPATACPRCSQMFPRYWLVGELCEGCDGDLHWNEETT